MMRNPVKQVTTKKEVMLLNPEDHRFTSLKVERETESIIYCYKHDGVQYRFFKLGPGWTGKNTRFLAVEGTPLISYISDYDEDGNAIYGTATLEEYLKLLWGEKGYKGLPDPLKQAAKLTDNIGTTISVHPYIPDKDTQAIFDEVKAEGILYDADLENLARFGESKEVQKWADKIMDRIPWILAGMGATYVLNGLGVLSGLS